MKLSGSFVVSTPRQAAYEFLTDPERLAPALPDIVSYEVRDRDHFTLDARVGVSNIRGPMKVKVELLEKRPDRRAFYRCRASGLGSRVDVDTGFDLADAEGGATAVHWTGEAKINGRLATIAGGLLEPLARKNITAFVDAVRRAL